MKSKKKYIVLAIVLFVFFGLTTYVFANPASEDNTNVSGLNTTKENAQHNEKQTNSQNNALNENNNTNGNLTTAGENNTAPVGNTQTTLTVGEAESTTETTPSAIASDTTAPEYKTLGLLNLTNYVAQEGSLNYAKVGDQIRVYLEFSEKLGKEAEVEINGKKEKLTYREPSSNEEASRYVYMADFTVDETYAEGAIQFTITGYEDKAGNEGNKLTAENINHKTYSGVIVDKTAAKRTAANMLVAGKSNEKDGPVYYANAESKVYTYVTFNEQLKENPTYVLTNNGKEIDVTDKVKESKDEKTGKYTYSVTVPVSELEGFTDGEVTFKVSNIKDKAGNETKDVTATTNGHQVIIDTIAPKVWVDDKEDSAKVIEGVAYTTSGNANTNVHDANPFTFTIKDSEGKEVKTLSYKYAPGEWYGNKDYAFRSGISHLIKEKEIYTIVAIDGAGNKTEYKFYWDKTPAKLTAANMLVSGKSNEKDGPVYYASAESKVYTYVTFNEQLKEIPTYVLINNGKEIDVTNKVKESKDEKTGKYTYSVTVPVSELEGFTDGEVTFKVSNIQDKIGNKTADVAATTNGHQVIIDTVAPVVYAGSKAGEATLKDDVHYTNNNNSNVDVRDANPFTMVVTDSEEKEVLTREGTAKDGKYYFRGGIGFAIQENKVYTVTATDKAGNKTVYKFAWDKTAPEATQVTMNNNTRLNEGVDAKSAKAGDWIWIYATFNEELRETPSLKVGDNEGTLVYSSLNENNSGLYTYVMQVNLPAGIADGKVPFTITNIYDALGNKAEDITATIGETSTWLEVDNTKSTVYVGTPKNNNGYESVEYNGVVYTRDKNVNVKDANPFTFVVKDSEGNVVSPAKNKTNAGEYNEKTQKYEFRKQIHVADGAYTVVVTDEAGNVQEYAYTLDTTIPEITTISVAEDGKTLIDEGKRIQLKDNTYYTYEIKNSEGKVVRDLKDKETKEVKYEQSGSMKLDYLPGGEYTITVTDIAGNVATKTFAIDKTPAKLTAANMLVAGKSNETDGPVYYANAESKINTYVTFNEQLKEIPTYVLINNGKEIDVTDKVKESKDEKTGKYTYSVTVPVSELEGFSDGEVTFRVSNIKDKSGNDTADVTATTNGHQVIIDTTAPNASAEFVAKATREGASFDNSTFTYYVRNNGRVEIYATFNEELSVVPNISINGTDFGPMSKVNNSKNRYQLLLPITESVELEDGLLDIKMFGYKDLADNEGPEISMAANGTLGSQQKVVLDRTAPVATIRMYDADTSEEITGEFTTSKKIRVEIEWSEKVNGFASNDISYTTGWDASTFKTLEEGKKYEKIYTLKDEDVNELKITLDDKAAKDLAGNESAKLEKQVKVDFKAPEITATGKHKEVEGKFEDGKSYQKVSFTITDPNLSTDETKGQIIIKLNGKEQPKEEIPAGKSYTKDFTEDGNYEVTIQDIIGNSVVKKFTVDTKAPRLSCTAGTCSISIEQGIDAVESIRNKVEETYTAKPNLKISFSRPIDTSRATSYSDVTITIEDEAGNVLTKKVDSLNIKASTKTMINIGTASDLKKLYTSPANYQYKTVVLTDDIDLDDLYDYETQSNWKPLNGEKLYGLTINGNGHTIKNMKIRDTDSESRSASFRFGYGLGFIGYNNKDNSGITISNIKFDNANITATNNGVPTYVGVVIGVSVNTTSLDNITVTNSIVNGNEKSEAGGLVGHVEPGSKQAMFYDCVVTDSTISGVGNTLAGSFVGGTEYNADVIIKNSKASIVKVHNMYLKDNYWVGGQYAKLSAGSSFDFNVQNTNKEARPI